MAADGVGALERSTFVLRALLVLDAEGRRIASRFYSPLPQGCSSEEEFERAVNNRAPKQPNASVSPEAEVDMLFGCTVLHRFSGELQVAAVGARNENELMLSMVATALSDAFITLLGSPLTRRAALENLDLVLVALDETCDSGILLEHDADMIAQRASLRTDDSDAPLAEQSISQAIAAASDQLKKHFAG